MNKYRSLILSKYNDAGMLFHKYRYRVLAGFILGGLVDLIFIKAGIQIILVVLFVFWVVVSRLFNLSMRFVSMLFLGSLLISWIFLLFGVLRISERFAIWAFLFLVTVVFQWCFNTHQMKSLEMYEE